MSSVADRLDFDFFDGIPEVPEGSDSDPLTAAEIESLVDTLIEGAFAFEDAVSKLTGSVEVAEKDSDVLWGAIKVLDAYQGLLNRAAIHQRVEDLDTP